jgi:hypothetical protein
MKCSFHSRSVNRPFDINAARTDGPLLLLRVHGRTVRIVLIYSCDWLVPYNSRIDRSYLFIHFFDAPRSSCTLRNVVVGRSTLEAKKKKMRSWTAIRAKQRRRKGTANN